MYREQNSGNYVMYREQNSGKNNGRNYLKLWNNSKPWERFLRNQNCIHEEIKNRLN
jgi:hypothetical protein